MAGSPKYKVYRDGEYVASCRYVEDAAAFVAISGDVVKYQHEFIIWREGKEEFSAGESYSNAAFVMVNRIKERYPTWGVE